MKKKSLTILTGLSSLASSTYAATLSDLNSKSAEKEIERQTTVDSNEGQTNQNIFIDLTDAQRKQIEAITGKKASTLIISVEELNFLGSSSN